MTGRTVLYNILVLVFVSSQSYAQNYPDYKVDSLLQKGIDHIIWHEYADAKSDFKTLDDINKALPLGAIYLAGTYISEAYDLGIEYPEKLIDSLLEVGIERSDSLLDSDFPELWAQYFSGLSHGFKAYYNALNGDYLKAFLDGFSSLKYFERCLEIDNNFHEAELAIGTYIYWKSVKTESLDFLPFFRNDKIKGINLLKSSSENISYNNYMAKYSLVWVFINENRLEEALKICSDFLDICPKSRSFIMTKANIMNRMDKPDEALKNYELLLGSYQKASELHYVNEVEIKHKMAQIYDKLGEYNKVINLCNTILSIKSYSEFELIRLDERLKKVEELRNKALRLASKN